MLIFLPIALLAIALSVRASFAPLRRFRERLAARGARDLSLVPPEGLPEEVTPVANTLNDLLERLSTAFEAERSFAANAAHEPRTPIAGALAQVQRLQAETNDPATRTRASDIESTLKRLTRLAERLMQLARAEGGKLRLERTSDLRIVARLLTDELCRMNVGREIALTLPPNPIISDLDPDIFAILYRNLVENALRHGAVEAPILISISNDGMLTVANDGKLVPKETLDRLVNRFERAGKTNDGSGLGLAIVHAIAQRIGGELVLKSPRTGRPSGFEASLLLPIGDGVEP